MFCSCRLYFEALEILNDLEAVMPNSSSFFSLRSNILRRKGKWEESLRDEYRAITLDPLNIDAYNQIGHTYRLMRKYSDAVTFYKKCIQLDSTRFDKSILFVPILLWKGDLREAVQNAAESEEKFRQNSALMYGYYYCSRQFEKMIPAASSAPPQVFMIRFLVRTFPIWPGASILLNPIMSACGYAIGCLHKNLDNTVCIDDVSVKRKSELANPNLRLMLGGGAGRAHECREGAWAPAPRRGAGQPVPASGASPFSA